LKIFLGITASHEKYESMGWVREGRGIELKFGTI
jgi:hypothetical protein